MKKRRRLSIAGLATGLVFCLTPSAAQSANDPPTHQDLLKQVETEDSVLKEQIAKVAKVLDQLHYQMAEKRQAIQAASDPARKSALTAELDALRKEHDLLEKLLHDLVYETAATELTQVDEALRRIKRSEDQQEIEDRQEETARDRQDQNKE